MDTGKQKPPAVDALELLARAIGERLMKMHSFMRIRNVDVVDGVALVDRVALFPCEEDSTGA